MPAPNQNPAPNLMIDSRSSVDSGAPGDIPRAVLEKGYIFGEELGTGAFSRVYKVSNSKPNFKYPTPLACKRFDLTNDEQEVWREKCLKQEMRIMLKLKHPNIIRAYEVVKTRKSAFIFMQFCKNGNISSYLTKTGKPIEEKKSRKWIHDIFKAIVYLHSKSIAHRDIKPENFMLDNDYKDALIADFGFSCQAVDKERLMKGTNCGTDGYKSPELLALKDGYVYDPKKVDIYAMGVSLFEMLNHYKPFGDTIDANTVKNQKNRFYIFNKNANLSKTCQTFCSLLLEPKVENRVTAEEAVRHVWFEGLT